MLQDERRSIHQVLIELERPPISRAPLSQIPDELLTRRQMLNPMTTLFLHPVCCTFDLLEKVGIFKMASPAFAVGLTGDFSQDIQGLGVVHQPFEVDLFSLPQYLRTEGPSLILPLK